MTRYSLGNTRMGWGKVAASAVADKTKPAVTNSFPEWHMYPAETSISNANLRRPCSSKTASFDGISGDGKIKHRTRWSTSRTLAE